MTVGERIEARRKAVGIKSQAELARRAKVPQGTMNGLISSNSRWSPHLPKIARELGTTVDYLIGASEDADAGAVALPPPPLFLRVELPPEEALAAMFASLLDGLDPEASRDEQALQLAQQLPIGLSHIADAHPAPKRVRRSPGPAEPVEPSHMPDDGRPS